MTEREDIDDLVGPGADPIKAAICPLIVAVIEMTEPGSRRRAQAMSEVLEAAERVQAALSQPRLN